MNTDDPKFTAYALGEFEDLTPAERAEIAALLASDKEAAQEAETMHALAARLRRDLQAEESAPLTEEQRASVLAAKVVPVDFGKAASAPRGRSWRVLTPLAMVASVALCAVIAWKAEFSPKPREERVVMTEPPATPVEVVEQPAPESVAGIAAYSSAADAVAGSEVGAMQAGANASELAANALDGRSAAGGRGNRAAESGRSAPPVAAFTPAPFKLATEEDKKPEAVKKTEFAIAPAKSAGSAIAPVDSSRVLADTARAMEKEAAVAMKASTVLGEDVVPGNGGKRDGQEAPLAPPLPEPTALASPSMVPSVENAQVPALRGKDVEMPAAIKSPRAKPATAAPKPAAPAPAADLPSSEARFGAATGVSQKGQGQGQGQGAILATTRNYDGAARGLASDDLQERVGQSWNRERQADESTAESYDFLADNAFMPVGQAPLSTFSIDVDTASYAIVRRFLNGQRLPPKGAVRVEELINYFSYDYPQPKGDAPFSATMEVADCPWAPAHRLVRIGLKGREIDKDKRPPSNIVFLIDVSGSMEPANKLPLLKQSLGLMIDQLGEEDQVGMVVYAGSSGTVLEPTNSKPKMRAALGKLESGGSTNGASGVQLAYQLAENNFIKGGTNRVVLATDGDWNVGITRPDDLFDLITKKAKSGVFLTVLGYGMDNLKDSMLVKLADKGNGNYGYIDTLLEAKKMLSDELTSTLVTIAKDVKIQVEFNPSQVAAYRLIGYEKRMLAKEDFNNDAKDAGEIGAGHTVTALYEVIPAGGDVSQSSGADELKYQRPAPVEKPAVATAKLSEEVGKEMLTLKLRYKAPDGDVSKLLEFPLTDNGTTWAKSTRDFRFAAAVAGYGMLLRDSPHKGTTTWNSVREWAVEGSKDKDSTGYRAEFITLVEKARALAR